MISVNGLGTWIRAQRRLLDGLPAFAGIGLGLLGGAAAAKVALGLGPEAVGILVLGFGLSIWGVGRRIRLVAAGYPPEVAVKPTPPGPRLGEKDDDEEEESQDAHLEQSQESAAARPAGHKRDLPIDMVELAGGHFWMGSDKSLDPDARDDELPRRRVRLSPFAIASVPVTRGLWRRVMAEAQSPWARPVPEQWAEGGDDLPATHVSWLDCLAFCNALSLLSGRSPCYSGAGEDWTCGWSADGYRLPTEAEWEYACRAGSVKRWFWGDDEGGAGKHAWYSANSGTELHPVGQKSPNEFGLYDMSGNCSEWCWDWHAGYDEQQVEDPRGPGQGRRRALRGGSFVREPGGLRSALRARLAPELRADVIGFRCVRSGARSVGP